jgi:hypothetical protein
MKKLFAAFLLMGCCSLSAFGQADSRADLLKDLEAKRAELATLEKKFLAPAPEDQIAIAEFLAQPDTGLIRLLPREKFDTVANSKSSLTIRGGGAYYSFARLTHEYGYGSDIELSHGFLSVGFAGADYGMLLRLDGARLEDVSTELPGVMFLAKYNAPADESSARLEHRRFSAGAIVDGATYKGRVPVEVGATYVLRSISYSDSDVLVAFKVMRQDTDGSLIIAWKLLQRYPTPKLALNK